MGKAPSFQFYIKDWLSDPALQAASSSTRGIWINALCFMWEAPQRGELVATPKSMARLLGATAEEFDLFVSEAIDLKFGDVTFCNSKVTLRNRRMYREQQEREKTRKRVAKHRAKQASNAGGNKKVTPPSSSSSSGTKVPEEPPYSPPAGGRSTKEIQAERFDAFWKSYPKKVGKGAARRAWAKIKPSQELLAEMLQALAWQTKSEQWTRDGGQFIPNPATWLNQERWNDEPPARARASPFANLSPKGQRTAENLQRVLARMEAGGK